MHRLVRPPKGHGFFREDFIECHGLTWFDVQGEPEFPEIAPLVLEYLGKADVIIAHNAQFEMRMLSGTMGHFGIAYPEFGFFCTLRAARRVWPELPSHDLGTLAAHIGHQFCHHDPQADAEAAGRVLMAMLRKTKAEALGSFLELTGLELQSLPASEQFQARTRT
jgi:DNA polymerase-3 subunit epsilon